MSLKHFYLTKDINNADKHKLFRNFIHKEIPKQCERITNIRTYYSQSKTFINQFKEVHFREITFKKQLPALRGAVGGNIRRFYSKWFGSLFCCEMGSTGTFFKTISADIPLATVMVLFFSG